MSISLAYDFQGSNDIRTQPIERAQALVRALHDANEADCTGEGEMSLLHSLGFKAWLETTTPPIVKFNLHAQPDSVNASSEENACWVVGTENWVDVRLPGPDRSSFYFAIECTDGNWFLTSLDDMPPIRVNGEPVRVASLEDGDEIETENFLLVFNTMGFDSKGHQPHTLHQ